MCGPAYLELQTLSCRPRVAGFVKVLTVMIAQGERERLTVQSAENSDDRSDHVRMHGMGDVWSVNW